MKILNQFNTNYDVLHDVDNHQSTHSSALKGQQTNCIKIFNLKEDSDIRVFCSISNFENAIDIGDVPNNKKTQTIYEILHGTSDTDEFAKPRRIVENLFEQIINRNEEKTLDIGFRRINVEQDYDDFFVGLIKQKTDEEMEAKKKKEEEEKAVSQQ